MAALGIVAEPTDLLADLVAASPNFQAASGSLDEAAARSRVATVSAKIRNINPGGDVPYRAFATVSMPMGEAIGRGGFASGELLLIFEDQCPPEFRRDPADDDDVDNAAASEPFRNWVGAVLEDMMIEQEAGGRLMLRSIKQESPLVRAPKGADVDYFQVAYRVMWGTAPK